MRYFLPSNFPEKRLDHISRRSSQGSGVSKVQREPERERESNTVEHHTGEMALILRHRVRELAVACRIHSFTCTHVGTIRIYLCK